MSKIMAAVLSVAILCFTAITAAAFIPVDVELEAAVRSGNAKLDVWTADVTFPDYPEEELRIIYSGGRWKQVWKSDNGTAAAVGAGDRVFAACPNGAFPAPVLFPWQPPQPVEWWRSLGVDNATGGFGFCNEEPCYYYGSEPGLDNATAVTLQSENWAVMGLFVKRSFGDMRISYSDYHTVGGFALPSAGEIVLPDHVKVAFRVKWSGLRKDVDPGTFSTDMFYQTYGNMQCQQPQGAFQLLLNMNKWLTPIGN